MQVSKFDTPEESAKLVAYFNKNDKTKIKFWGIGNEPYHMGKISQRRKLLILTKIVNVCLL